MKLQHFLCILDMTAIWTVSHWSVPHFAIMTYTWGQFLTSFLIDRQLWQQANISQVRKLQLAIRDKISVTLPWGLTLLIYGHANHNDNPLKHDTLYDNIKKHHTKCFKRIFYSIALIHYIDVIMGAIACQITSLTIVYSTNYSDANQRKHQNSASLAFVWGIYRSPVNSPHKWPVTHLHLGWCTWD